MLAGMAQHKALVKAGYTKATARAPHKGARAESCIAEARKLHPEIDPGKIVEKARRTLSRKLEQLLDDKQAIARANLGAVARTAEVVERWYGDRAPKDGHSATAFVDRMQWIREVLLELERRGKSPQHMGSGSDNKALCQPGDPQDIGVVDVSYEPAESEEAPPSE